MSDDPNKHRMLADILAEESNPAFRDELLGQTLRLVRRRKRVRAVGRFGVATAMIIVAGLFTVHFLLPRRHSVTASRQTVPQREYALIQTQPMDRSMIVTTRQQFSSYEVATRPFDLVTTEAARPLIAELTDDQLLALTKDAPVALVRDSSHEAELVFINEGDREKLFRN